MRFIIDNQLPSALATHLCRQGHFLSLSLSDPNGPAFVWIRLGNCRIASLLAAFDLRMADILRELEAGQRVIEVR